MNTDNQAPEVFDNLIDANSGEAVGRREPVSQPAQAEGFRTGNAPSSIRMLSPEQIRQRAHDFGERFKEAALRQG